MSLPQKLPYELMLTKWAAQLNPVLANPIIQGIAIDSILLDANVPKVIPIKLGRVQQGWLITDNLAFCKIKRTAGFNATTLTLESDADTTISIWVY